MADPQHYQKIQDDGSSPPSDEPAAPQPEVEMASHGAGTDIRVTDRVASAGLWCRNLSYTVAQKKILNNITMTAMPGEITMVMGPSGAGKTTLLNCLLNRVRVGGVDGDRGLNAEFASKDLLKRHAHYVMQYDVTLSYLTVKETLKFSANLRMPGTTEWERQEAVAKVIDWMELQDCQDTYCGGDWRKGISKGQMKRLAIAQELLGDPPVLVLDEPTTGLDSCLALELVGLLRRVARETSITLIASIHQPSQRAFEQFDQLVLLSGGGLLYCGPAAKAIEYFASVGKQCPPGFSPPDYLLELATDETFKPSRVVKGRHSRADASMTLSTGLPGKGRAAPQGTSDEDKENEGITASPSAGQVETDTAEPSAEDQSSGDPVVKAMKFVEMPNYSTGHELDLMKERFTQRTEHREVIDRISRLEKLPLPPKKTRGEEDNSWRFQFRTLWKRSTLNTMRNPLTSFIIVIVNIIQALLLGALFFQLQSDVDKPHTTYTQIRDYSFWESAPIQFLAYGLDKNGTDPFLDMIFNGVNTATGANLLFDMAVDQKLLPYLGDVVTCTRTLYEDKFFAPSGLQYPRWYWPEGSIDGNPQTTTTTTTAAPGTTIVRRLQADPAETEVAASDEVEPSFGTMSFEKFSNTVMGLMQLLDYWATDKRPLGRMDFGETDYAELMGFWMTAFGAVTTYANPLFCCMGLGYPADMFLSDNCETLYPGYTLPVLPGYQDATVKAAVDRAGEIFSEPETKRALQAAASSVSSFTKKTLLEIKEDQKRRKIANPTLGSVMRKLSDSSLKSAASNFLAATSNPLLGLVEPKRAPKRRLGSGLGGLVTDIWDTLFNDEDSPLYALTNNLIGWFDRFEACDNSYCEVIVDTYNTVRTELTNLANSFLSVLNMAGAVFFCCVNLGFSSYDVLLQFPKDRAIFNRERANGLYKTSSYFFAKMISDLPFQLIPCIFWTIIFYFMVGFASTATQFFQFMGVCLLTSFTCYSFGYMTSALSARLEVAVVVAPLVLVIMMIFAGFFLRDESMPAGIEWLKYFSIFRWGFFALNTVQFPPGGVFGSMDNNLSLAVIGVTHPQIWLCSLVLLAQAAGFRILGYVALRWCNKSVGMEA